MADAEAATTYSGMTLEALQSQSAHSRRLRPPDMEIVVGDENRVPLRGSKLGRRESRIGLRNLFGSRSRTAKEIDGMSSLRETSRPVGIRASLAEISNWPYSLQAQRSEITLPTIQSRPTSSATDAPPANPTGRKKSSSLGRVKPMSATPVKSPRGSLATWDPPPLFQAYPQAIRHVQLQASSLSTEAILRMNDKKALRDDLTLALKAEQIEEALADKKKKHRQNASSASSKFDWTTKIFVLVTSGYLLQYSGEGSFDRLPEKMLHLGKDSAAFASDVIPGRHWVLQVASVMEPDGTPASDSRSLLSRLPFRAGEKRNVSNFLMVFDSAEEMETWMSILRREIEALGGKKALSETGKPKADDNVVQLRAQPSQRTLIVRDPDRFSRAMSQDLDWQAESPEDPDGSVTVVESESMHEQSLDDISTTNSVVSHDGRQLESLRDSAHRLSCISSGQPTFVTSAGSSPASSPTRDSFPNLVEEPKPRDSVHEARVRPNASAISDRRQSMLTMGPFVDLKASNPPRPHSTYNMSVTADAAPLDSVQTIPNFSVPHSASRRYSLAKTPPMEAAPFSPQLPKEREHARFSRKSPPTSLPISRPLSIVADQPSPSDAQPRLPTRDSDDAVPEPESTITVNVTPPRPVSRARESNTYTVPFRLSSLASKDHSVKLAVRSSPRKSASVCALRNSDFAGMPPPDILVQEVTATKDPLWIPSPPPIPDGREGRQRAMSSMDNYGRSRSRSPSARNMKHIKRISLQPGALEHRPARFSFSSVADSRPRTATSCLGDSPPRSLRLSPAPVGGLPPLAAASYLGIDLQAKGLLNRRSMPHLIDGPPPMPPPTCALPPIPQKPRAKT